MLWPFPAKTKRRRAMAEFVPTSPSQTRRQHTDKPPCKSVTKIIIIIIATMSTLIVSF